ncbi:transposable element Tcb2 transposase [Trichonephila clavipes]|nr:transposable element Tcb2 transposase [Trichonephila clavipes]
MTIHRRLIDRNFRSYRPLRELLLTPAHSRARLQWCLARSVWNHFDWRCIVFRFESRFQLCPEDQRRHVWELAEQRYVDDILRTVLLPFLLQYTVLIFVQDNDKPHTARVTMNYLTACQTHLWPSKSPDFSHIEHVWYVMGRRLYLPGNADNLARQFEQIWQEISWRPSRWFITICHVVWQLSFSQFSASVSTLAFEVNLVLYQWFFNARKGHNHWEPNRGWLLATDHVILNHGQVTLTDSEAWRVVGRLEGDQTQAEVAQANGVSQSGISRIWNQFLETESAGRRPEQGRKQATTPNEDRYLVLTARRHRNMNATILQQHLRSATGTRVSTQTVRNRLHGLGLNAHRPMVRVRLTSRHRRERREWATEHVNWRRNDWSNVPFSDESRFSVQPDNRRIFIWRRRGIQNNPAFVHESVRFGSGGVLVYGGISIDGRTDLYIIRDGPLTAPRYRDEILRPIVVSYASAIGYYFILMHDNYRSHRVNLVEDFPFEEGIVQME